MHHREMSTSQRSGLETSIRNRYFFGKLLDVYHFELETNYFIRQRRRLNRLVSGFGVVCGLNVEVGQEANQIMIESGVAIDPWGREIVVAQRTDQITIPADVLQRATEKAKERREDPCVQVLICYHESPSDPAPILAGDCLNTEPCTPGTIREQYRIVFDEECAPQLNPRCRIPDVLAGGRLDYDALVKWVTITRGCPELRLDPCIPLANISLSSGDMGHSCNSEDIDITIRPILYSNRLLFELILALIAQGTGTRRPNYD